MSVSPHEPPDLRIDPTGLEHAALGADAVARELSAAVAEVNTAWIAASSSLVGTRCASTLDACRAAALSMVRSSADAVAHLAADLLQAAGLYRTDDQTAMPAAQVASGQGSA